MIANAEGTAQLALSHAEVEKLAREAGPTFYLLDLDRIREDHDELAGAFRRRYPDFVLAYSVKTNYTPRILTLLRELGSLAEVVSHLEYEIVRRAGFSDGEIIVNGPLHEPAFLEHALLQGIRVNLDGWHMLEALHDLGQAHPGRSFHVGLRLNYPVPGADWSRFGFSACEAEMRRVAQWFQDHPRCAVAGLHSHFALASYSLESFRARAEGLVHAARTWLAGTRLEYLDIGGGIRPHSQGPSLADLADVVAGALEQGFAAGERPALVIEPGTALVALAMAFVCRVQDVKRVQGRTLALVDGSSHCFNTMQWHQRLTVQTLRAEPRNGDGEVFDVVGNTPMERKDHLCTGVPGPVAKGDYVVFDGVGAYSIGLKPPFTQTCPPMVGRQGGRHEIIKRRETVDDILRTFCF